MVFLPGYIEDVIEELRDQRKDGTMCDANVTVGETKIPAHKCVLVACSNFCKSVYTGTSKKEDIAVDLSEVTKNIKIVEAVVDFMYSGLIDIDYENIETVLKLSSYLVITPLRDLCVEFITTNITMIFDLDTCLKYYLISVDFMIPKLEKIFHQTIRPRFHDCIIFKPSSLKISPKHLHLLLKVCNIFEHCSNVDIISFLIEWIKDGETAAHEQVGCEVLDYVSTKNAKLLDGSSKEDTKDLVERMNTKLEDLETFTRFKQRLCSLMTEWIKEAEDKPDLLNMNALAAEIGDSEALSTDSGIENENERILLAVIPNKYLLDLVEKRPKKHTYIYDRIKGNNAIYGICVYVPRTQTWYHMTECRPERAFKVSTPNAIPCDITQSYVKFNKLYIVSQHKSAIYIFNLESYEWDTLDFKQPVDDNASGMSGSLGNRVYIVPVNESTLYLILSLVGVGRRGRTGVPFKCFKLASGNTWQFMFSTPVVEEYSQLKEFSAIYSPSNKELVIVYRGDFTVVIHRNTPDLEGSKFGILRPEMDCIGFDTCWVLEDDKNIRIVGRTFDEDVYLIRCKCQYDLKSREWTKMFASDCV